MIKALVTNLKKQPISERILFALSTLLFVFVTPTVFIRLFQQNWPIFFLDLFIVGSAAFIFYNTYRRRYVEFLKFYMCCLTCAGVSATVVLGGIEQIYWIYPTTLTAFFLVKRVFAFCFTTLISLAIAPTVISSAAYMESITIYFALFGLAAFITVFTNELLNENKSLTSQVMVDPLTGLDNRRKYEVVAEECRRVLLLKGQVSTLVIIDIDDFKCLNDTYGHLVGDKILQHLGLTISKRLVDNSSIYRLGGEEFAVIVKNGGFNDGLKVTELIQFVLKNERDDSLPEYTVSMGVATLHKSENTLSWFERADKAMYKSKQAGKNRISAAEEYNVP